MADPASATAGDAVTDDATLPGRPVLRALGLAAGLDLGAFRDRHVALTIARAVTRLDVRDATELAVAVAADPALRARFRRAVAVSTTGMFRDPEQFELLDRLLEEHGERGRPPRVWSIGASDGSELCSVAMLLAQRRTIAGATLLGSDLLPENVELARERSRERLDPAVHETVHFEERDVSAGAPGGTWDVVLCRNVLIHLGPKARSAILDRAARALTPGGLLLLGRSERLPRDDRRGLQDAGANAYRRVA